MTWWQAVVLGIVEGVTEYLPISSTGHLILCSALLGLGRTAQEKQAVDAFNIVIQGGAILAVLGLYRARVAQMIRGLLGGDPAGRRLAVNLIVAFLPAAVIGVLIDEHVERLLFHAGPVLAALALGGVALIAMGPWQRRVYHDQREGKGDGDGDDHVYVDIEHLSWKQALIVGLLQCVAMWPGTSRSMMTIIGGMLVGMRPRHAAEFSFLLGLPTLGGACVYKAYKNFSGAEQNMLEVLGPLPVIIGFLCATVSAALAVRWLVGYLSNHGLAVFGWYRLGLCAVLGALILTGRVSIDGPRDAAARSQPPGSAGVLDLPELLGQVAVARGDRLAEHRPEDPPQLLDGGVAGPHVVLP